VTETAQILVVAVGGLHCHLEMEETVDLPQETQILAVSAG
jgi:hypothetical protein